MTIEQRLNEIENSVKRWKQVSATLGIAILAVIAVAASPSDTPSEVVKTHRLQVVNDKGDVVAEMNSSGEAFSIYDGAHNRAVAMRGTTGGGEVEVYGISSGKETGSISLTGMPNTAEIVIRPVAPKATDMVRISANLRNGGGANLRISDWDGHQRVSMEALGSTADFQYRKDDSLIWSASGKHK